VRQPRPLGQRRTPNWPGADTSPALLLNRRSARLSTRCTHDILGALADAARLQDDFTSHVLRHTFASNPRPPRPTSSWSPNCSATPALTPSAPTATDTDRQNAPTTSSTTADQHRRRPTAPFRPIPVAPDPGPPPSVIHRPDDPGQRHPARRTTQLGHGNALQTTGEIRRAPPQGRCQAFTAVNAPSLPRWCGSVLR
jgi:hypothetical protein